ncbi:MAG: hypothetical protein L0Z70_03285 [Chloroflexi bacterium]|nr:hypothetical protein [Chloroflexota bacterium]
MDIFFQDPTAIPLPPQEVRITALRAEPWPDGRRVKVSLTLTPFLQRPDGEISIVNPSGQEAAFVSIVEALTPQMDFTMHLRGEILPGRYTVSALVFYEERPALDAEDAPPRPAGERQVVDSRQALFEILP